MSVITYLQGRASAAVLSGDEEKSINTSIATIKSRLTSHFGTGLSEQFRFGSSTRGTILPRSMDEHSDIDYMVVFSDSGFTPQTYLDRIKRFRRHLLCKLGHQAVIAKRGSSAQPHQV
jgi:Second Messenger Oligonucleotide or Dinucleotide Synthetase domain